MRTHFDGELVPQKEEGIMRVCWVKQGEIKEKLKNSYGNIKALLKDE